MVQLTKVEAVTDESGHWYIIPKELSSKFSELSEASENDDDSLAEFDTLFGKYRTGGDLNNKQLYAYFEI